MQNLCGSSRLAGRTRSVGSSRSRAACGPPAPYRSPARDSGRCRRRGSGATRRAGWSGRRHRPQDEIAGALLHAATGLLGRQHRGHRVTVAVPGHGGCGGLPRPTEANAPVVRTTKSGHRTRINRIFGRRHAARHADLPWRPHGLARIVCARDPPVRAIRAQMLRRVARLLTRIAQVLSGGGDLCRGTPCPVRCP